MSLLEYYNNETKTLTLPPDFNTELIDLPPEVAIIIFYENCGVGKDSKFNQTVDKLPSSIKSFIASRIALPKPPWA